MRVHVVCCVYPTWRRTLAAARAGTLSRLRGGHWAPSPPPRLCPHPHPPGPARTSRTVGGVLGTGTSFPRVACLCGGWMVRVSAMCYDGPRPRDGERQHVPLTPAEPASSPKNQPSTPGWNKSACRCEEARVKRACSQRHRTFVVTVRVRIVKYTVAVRSALS
jgi:hypothetical protein